MPIPGSLRPHRMSDISLLVVPTSGKVKCDCCHSLPDRVVVVKHEYMTTRLCDSCVASASPGMTLCQFSARLHATPRQTLVAK